MSMVLRQKNNFLRNAELMANPYCEGCEKIKPFSLMLCWDCWRHFRIIGSIPLESFIKLKKRECLLANLRKEQ